MVEEKVMTKEMGAAIGSLVNVQVMQFDRRSVDQYIDATGDPNPLWRDDDFARKAGDGGVLVPPGLLVTMQMEGGSPSEYIPSQAHLGGAVDGGGEWEFFRPVKVGDVITAVRKLVGMTEKKGKLGPMILNTFEVTYHNQRSDVVARSRWTTIRYATK